MGVEVTERVPSLALSVLVPEVFRVMGSGAVPLLTITELGKVAIGSVEVSVTFPE
jgi:hypothetical protein